ncbi:hypothetical protein CsSME_00046708 [Camellia sinensis var. sinensis]
MNTHLIFPHDSSYCFVRLKQVYKMLKYIDSYCHENELPPVPVILCGDWNGSKKGNVYKFLQSQGFVSSYDIAHPYTNDAEDLSKWISHHNHRGNVCGVDFIFLHNPSNYQRPVKESFMEAVLGNIYDLSHKLSTKGVGPLHFFETGSSHITYSQFSQALAELGLSGHPQHSLGTEDIKDLWEHIDTDGDGVIDLLDFVRVWNRCSFVQENEENGENRERTKKMLDAVTIATTIRFIVSKAMFYPPEVARGMWPENYSLSDHAQLTVVFSPVQLSCSRVLLVNSFGVVCE